jgi:hypothetical protein
MRVNRTERKAMEVRAVVVYSIDSWAVRVDGRVECPYLTVTCAGQNFILK